MPMQPGSGSRGIEEHREGGSVPRDRERHQLCLPRKLLKETGGVVVVGNQIQKWCYTKAHSS